MLLSRLPKLVKGVGYAAEGGVAPLSENDDRVWSLAARAEKSLRKATSEGIRDPGKVVKGLNSDFGKQLAHFLHYQPQNNAMGQLVDQLNSVLSTELGKNISLTSPLSSGFVPYDLLAPSRLIYPVYSPMRNKLPRTPGQGLARLVKDITAVSGSRTGGTTGNSIRWSIAESGFSSWPNTLPAAGAQKANDFSIPYHFFGLSESLSWLAQFSGQGFEDISALANLILLQEAMIAEEDAIFSGTGTAVPAPGTPSLTARATTTGETGITFSGSPATTNVWVRVTALNYYGETANTVAHVATSAGQAVDVTIAPSKGAFTYNIYVGTGVSDPTASATYLVATGVGATNFTLFGAMPVTGTAAPTTDSGTSSANDYEGLMSICDGHGVAAGVYPAGYSGVGGTKSAGGVLSLNTLYPVLNAMWDSGSSADGVVGAFRANPAEIICEGGDASRLATDILSNGADTAAYRAFISQDEVGGVRTGAAVSEVQNPITRAVLKVLVHPWLTQGSAFLMSYTLPMAWSNVSNIFEMVMVQDLLSVSWPVIDATFRYSIFEYGALVAYAPQYCSVISGLQKSATKPYS